MTVEIYCNSLTRCECYNAYRNGGFCGWDSGPAADWNTSTPSEDLGFCRRGSTWDIYELEDLPSSCPWWWFDTNGGYNATNEDNCKVNYKNACSCSRAANKGCGWKSGVRYQDVITSEYLNSQILNKTGYQGGLTANFSSLGECRFGGSTHTSELDDSLGFFGASFQYSPGTDGFTTASMLGECRNETVCSKLSTPCACFDQAAQGCGWSSADFRNPGTYFSEYGDINAWRQQGRCRDGSTTTGYDVAIQNFFDDGASAPECLGEGAGKAGINCNDYSSPVAAPLPCQDITYGAGSDAWVDFQGQNCAWYAADISRCDNPEFTPFISGDFNITSDAAGVLATEACCACNGGVGAGGVKAKTGRCNCWENAVIAQGAQCGWDSQTGKCDYNSRFSAAEIAGCENQTAWSTAHIDEFTSLDQNNSTAAEKVVQRDRVYTLFENGTFDGCFAENGDDDVALANSYNQCNCLNLRNLGCAWVARPTALIETTRGVSIASAVRDSITNNTGFCSKHGQWDADLGAQEAWKCLIDPSAKASPLFTNALNGYLFDNGTIVHDSITLPSTAVPHYATVRGMCDPFNNITESCECYEHSLMLDTITYATAQGYDTYNGFTSHFADLWLSMYQFVAPFEKWNTTHPDLTMTPFYERSCWILYDGNGDPYVDADGNFLPNPNSLNVRCRPERFCGWSEEYISYASVNNSKYSHPTHEDNHGCFAGFQFTLNESTACPPPPPPYEPYATPKTACSQITDAAECWLYTLKDDDFAPYNLNCWYDHQNEQCIVSDNLEITPLFHHLENTSTTTGSYLTVHGAYKYTIAGSGPSQSTEVTKTGAGGYAYNGDEGYNYTGTHGTLYDTEHNNTYAHQLAAGADAQAQTWRPHFLGLQYARYKRVPFVEKDTCFIIGDIMQGRVDDAVSMIELSYISDNPFTNAESHVDTTGLTDSNFPQNTLNLCASVGGVCSVSSPMLPYNMSADNFTDRFFQNINPLGAPYKTTNRYEWVSVISVAQSGGYSTCKNSLNPNGGCTVDRTHIYNLNSTTRAPPTADLIVNGVQYTHTILGDENGKPYRYTPCINQTAEYLNQVAAWVDGIIDVRGVGDESFFIDPTAVP